MDLGGLADKAMDLAEQHADKVDAALDKAGDLAAERFGHEAQVDAVVDKLKDALPGEPQA
ncbi:MAG TPA: antitoxin [Pseudonocardiaceae bacterium]